MDGNASGTKGTSPGVDYSMAKLLIRFISSVEARLIFHGYHQKMKEQKLLSECGTSSGVINVVIEGLR